MKIIRFSLIGLPGRVVRHARGLIVRLVKERIPARFGLDPKADVQVLSPMYRGATGVNALNERLQASLNPPALMKAEKKLFGQNLRLGDKLMQIQNNYDKGVYVNSPSDIQYWVEEMHRRCIKPDIAIFEVGMVANSMRLAEEGWIQPPFLFTFVLGQAGAMPATPKNLLFLSETVPAGSLWSAAGHSGHDLHMSSLALQLGGHARAGFEDNPCHRSGVVATSNAQLIERLVRIAREIGREIASPAEARVLLGLQMREQEQREGAGL